MTEQTQPEQSHSPRPVLDQEEVDRFVLWAAEYAADGGVDVPELKVMLRELADLKLSATLWRLVNERRLSFHISELGDELIYRARDSGS